MNAQLKFHDVEQNTDAWLGLRAGKITSSNLSKIMANFGKAFGEPAKKLAIDIATEQVTGKPTSNGYSNAHTERGHEQEPFARALYETETFCTVSNGGFYCDDWIGCSPDGLVFDVGVIEIKSVIASVHYANLKRQNIDPAYKWQCIANLHLTGREWLDFISYCEDFPDDKKLFIYRLKPQDCKEQFNDILTRVAEFKKLVREARDNILKLNYRVY